MAVQKKVTKGVAIVRWDEKFAAAAKASKEKYKNVGGGVQTVKFAANRITYQGADVPGGRMNVIVLGDCFLHAYYAGKIYDPEDIQPPVCYALSEFLEDMAPHAECQEAQSSTCAECEHNQFGSAATGRGKSCQDVVRIAVISANDAEDGDTVRTAEIVQAKIPVTSVKNWAAYVKGLDGRPPWSVVTEIAALPEKNYYRLEFKLVETIDDNDILTALEARTGEKVQEYLQQPYAPPTEKPAKAAKPAAGRSNAKFAAKPAVGRGAVKR